LHIFHRSQVILVFKVLQFKEPMPELVFPGRRNKVVQALAGCYNAREN